MKLSKPLFCSLMMTLPSIAATTNITINTAAVKGRAVKVVIDVTANTTNLNNLTITNFAATGSTMGIPEIQGGLVTGDLILVNNPASFTSVETSYFFNEVIVNLNPVGNSVNFTLTYTQSAPSAGVLPDQISVSLLDSSYKPLFTTSDPLGTNALVAIDLIGTSTAPSIYSPAVQTTPGNISIVVPGSNSPPSVVSLSPVASSGANQVLTLQFSDPDGFADLNVLNLLINTALDGRHGCYLAYARPSNTMYLVDDAGDGLYAGTVALNGVGSVANSQCTVFSTGSSAVGSGNILTITLNMNFSTAFGGNKVVYMAARDLAGNNPGWQTMGVLGVPPLPSTFPNPVSVSPSSGSTSSPVLTFTYQDSSSALNLQTAWALINTALDGRTSCYVAYYRPGNLLFLFPDNGDGAQATSMILTGTNSVSNSQCTVFAQGSSATVSGALLTLNLTITFKPAFTGPKAVWMAVQTLAAQTSPWQALGAWRVP